MKLKIFTLMLILALGASPALAQDSTTIAVNDFSFDLDSASAANVNISLYPGDAPDVQQPGGPEVAHADIALYDTFPPESIYDATGNIRIYETADFADYDYAAQQLEQLQTLLDQRPDLAAYTTIDPENTSNNALPYMPSQPGSQLIRAQPRYVETASVKGITYITIFRMDVSPILGNEFVYTFQGISDDGEHYVSATFWLNAALFPAEIPADFDYSAFDAGFIDYLSESVATLTAATPADFTPSLDSLDALVQSFAFE